MAFSVFSKSALFLLAFTTIIPGIYGQPLKAARQEEVEPNKITVCTVNETNTNAISIALVTRWVWTFEPPKGPVDWKKQPPTTMNFTATVYNNTCGTIVTQTADEFTILPLILTAPKIQVSFSSIMGHRGVGLTGPAEEPTTSFTYNSEKVDFTRKTCGSYPNDDGMYNTVGAHKTCAV
ncbi:hypothetical protein MMC09_007012, partial [Bachmanniomyces sp. S44760]|nr:hypothetical protein [Bachmanniomyces sp. S44760]